VCCDDRAVLVLTRDEVESLLEPDALRAAVASAMVEVSSGAASMPARIAARVPPRDGFLAAMPAYLPSGGALATKLVTVFPANAGTAHPTHQAVIVVFDPTTGEPAALLDGTAITAARTAAGSALSTELLARHDATVLAVLGTGVQASAHLTAVARVRPFAEIRVAGRDAVKAARLATTAAATLGRDVVSCASFAEACRGADVVCATTDSPDPVVRREHLAPGVHVTSVGYNVHGRELDSATVADALVVVEAKEAALAPPPAGANDLRIPIDEGRITPDHVHAELGELVAGTRPGRATAEQITLYKSVGVAAQDVAAATLVVELARVRGAGRELDL
jgi:alanine dehydrogenase